MDSKMSQWEKGFFKLMNNSVFRKLTEDIIPVLNPTKTKEPCAICLGVRASVCTLCKHAFHKSCIKEWAKNSMNCPVSKKCTLCGKDTLV